MSTHVAPPRVLRAGARVPLAVCVAALAWALPAANAQDRSKTASSATGGLGESAVDHFYGELTHDIPIEPPVYHGIEPHLAISYRSSNGNGMLGVGWQLSGLSVIERVSPGRGLPRNDAADIWLLDGVELVPCVAGSVSPSCTTGGTHATKLESYQRIVRNADGSWVVTARDGTRSAYAVPLSNGQSVRVSVTDVHGNMIQYAYQTSATDPWPYLTYVYYNTSPILFFHYEPRPDPIVVASGGGLLTMSQRLKTITVGNPVARAVKLTYGTSATTGRSMLTGVQQYGSDRTIDASWTITGGAALPATTLGYAAPTNGLAYTGWTIAPGNGWNTFQIIPGDFNGDGRSDIYLHGTSAGHAEYMFLSNGTGFYNSGWTIAPGNGWNTFQIIPGDYNGDGKTDIYLHGSTAQHAEYMFLSNGTGFDNSGWTIAPGNGWNTFQIIPSDYNGDGKTDIYLHGSTAQHAEYMFLSNGTSFYSSGWTIAPGSGWNTFQIVPADYNGDGKTDIYLHGSTAQHAEYMFLSNGTGFYSSGWTIAAGSGWYGFQILPGDYNGDGAADIYLHGGSAGFGESLYLSTGSGFAHSGWSLVPAGGWYGFVVVPGDYNGDGRTDIYLHAGNTSYGEYLYLSRGASFADSGWSMPAGGWSGFQMLPADYSGDGKTDLYLHGTAVDVGEWLFACGGAGPTDLLTSIANGLGSTTTVTYAPSSTWTNTNNPPLRHAVAARAVTDGRGATATTTYTYAGGLYDAPSRRTLGFHYAKETLPCNPEDAGKCPAVETWFHQDYGSVSSPQQINRLTGTGVVLRSTVNEYATNGATIPYTSRLTGTWEYTYDGTGASKRTYTTKAYDTYGNVTSNVAYGNYDAAGDELTTTTTFVPNTGAYIVAAAASTTSYAGVGTAGAVLGQTQFHYDGAATWNQAPTRGDRTKTRQWLNPGNTWVTTSATYDTFGNVLTTTDELGNTSSVAYDTAGTHPVRVTNPIGHVATMTWNLCDQVNSTVAPNGGLQGQALDALCRPQATMASLPSRYYSVQLSSYTGLGNASAQFRRTETPPGFGGTAAWTNQYFDGRGRTYRTTTNGPATIYTDTAYNPRGQVASAGEPYYAGATARAALTTYDALDRPVRVTNLDGTTATITYGVWTSTITDALGHATRTDVDARGRVVAITRLSSGGNQTTTYTYDLLSRLTGVQDARGNAWTYTYDTLGRRLTVRDPDLGTWSYGYDAKGQLVSQTDAKGQTTTLTYDALGRKRTQTIAGVLTNTWTYDQARAGYANTGRLTSSTEPTGGTTTDYDIAGNLVHQVKTIDGTAYEYRYGYDEAGRLTWTTYPDGDTVGTSAAPLTFDAAGRPFAIPGIVTSTTYTASGAPATVTNANGTVATYTYDTRHNVASITTMKGTTTLQRLVYGRDAQEKVTSITSPVTGEGWTFGYDDLSRLTSATNPTDPTQNQTFTYDLADNLTSNSRLGAYTYPAQGATSVRPHAVTAAGGVAYGYDANGNLISKGATTYTWNGANQLAAIGTTSFAYDADNVRVKKASAAGTSYYPTPGYEVKAGLSTKHLALGSLTVAKRVRTVAGWTTTWLHGDHLGSPQVLTNASGLEIQRLSHRPYGERSRATTAFVEETDFVGERLDSETGLVYMRARYYDPVLGRFTAADASSPTNPRVGTNRYAYALNDPVNLRDDGHEAGWFGWDAQFDNVPWGNGRAGWDASGSAINWTNSAGANSPVSLFSPYHWLTSDRVEGWSISIAENVANQLWGQALGLAGVTWINPIDAQGNFNEFGLAVGIASVMVKLTTEVPLIFIVTPFVALAALIDDAVEAVSGDAGAVLPERTADQVTDHALDVAAENVAQFYADGGNDIANAGSFSSLTGVDTSAIGTGYTPDWNALASGPANDVNFADFGGPGSNAYNDVSFSSWESDSFTSWTDQLFQGWNGFDDFYYR
ncbi:MAG: VCBS repeat-containing protein [Myxococcales bacterium]|nr:VCBS repeat-containing protein [Myxococcales bacterium]